MYYLLLTRIFRVLETEPIVTVIVAVPALMPIIMKPLYFPPPMVDFSPPIEGELVELPAFLAPAASFTVS